MSVSGSAPAHPNRSTWSFDPIRDRFLNFADHNRRISMTAKLDKTIKRELEIDGKAYTIAISPEGVKVTEKGRRNGPEVSWRAIISGDTSLNEKLNESVDATAGQEGSGLSPGGGAACRRAPPVRGGTA